MTLYTIGFTKKSAQTFFTLLQHAPVARLVDVRLNNISQLAGFAKRDDLRYFTNTICGIPYIHTPTLAPTQPMLDAYKKQHGSWPDYEQRFNTLITERRIEVQPLPNHLNTPTPPRELLDGACLLCSEEKPHHCHRRLVAEYLRNHWENIEIHHLG